ncbi:unnamed protein product [Mytilus coruscus]|uniref:Uncharacterized protein n=1 Tax=Mytilus coruscus TaxID=42192 RepID=A0A6J8AAW6_MYTCO|nr:unnamed protein product [Mytilus coruscus]
MGNIDSIPLISQTKSLFQVMTGDVDGALQTAENFAETGIIGSQLTSLVHIIDGNEEAARETQQKFGKSMESLADSIPVVGHIKGAIHYDLGQTEKGDSVFKSASGSLLTIPAAVAGTLVDGPAGGAAAAVLASKAYDGIVTGIDTAVNGHAKMEDLAIMAHGIPGTGFDAVGGATGVKVGRGVGGYFKAVGREIGDSIPGSSVVKRIGKPRCKRDIEYHLSHEEAKFAGTHLKLEGGMTEIINANWQNMSIADNLSSVISLFVILKLVLWNDKNGRNYSRELCSYSTTTEEDIRICQLALLNNIRRLENKLHDQSEQEIFTFVLNPDVPFEISNSSTILIKTVTSLYGILSSIGMNNHIGVTWAEEVCFFENPRAYKSCEDNLSKGLSTINGKAFHLGEKRKRRATCNLMSNSKINKETPNKLNVPKKTEKAKNKNNPSKSNVDLYKKLRKKDRREPNHDANHVPAASAFKDFNINPRDLPAHHIPRPLHQKQMTKVGTSKSSNIAKTLRHYESELLKMKRLDQALELDFIASYGRANVDYAKGGFRPALVKYRKDLKQLADSWSDIIQNNPEKFGRFIEAYPRFKLEKVKKSIDAHIKKYKEFENEGLKGNKDWQKNWIEYTEQKYKELITSNNLEKMHTIDTINLPEKDYLHGK